MADPNEVALLDRLPAATIKAVSFVLPAMGFDAPVLLESDDASWDGVVGSTIELVGPVPVRLGLFVTASDGEWMARTALGIEEDEVFESSYVADTLRELSNVLAGTILRELAKHGHEGQIGLPRFVRGIRPPQNEHRVVLFNISGRSITLLMTTPGR